MSSILFVEIEINKWLRFVKLTSFVASQVINIEFEKAIAIDWIIQNVKILNEDPKPVYSEGLIYANPVIWVARSLG